MKTILHPLRAAVLVFLALLFSSDAGAQTFETVFSHNIGSSPRASLVRGSDGNFYGTTYEGGVNAYGTVFKMTPNGALTTLVSFTSTTGRNPYAGLVEGSDGNFYGTTYGGGTSAYGTVFKMTPGGALTTLVSFNDPNGRNPQSTLVQGSDGNFYGTTINGGASGYGTVFKVTPGGGLTTLVSFNSTAGRRPYAGLVEGSDGNFYGTTSEGGTSIYGTIFKVTPAGALTTLVSFNSTNGRNPHAGLVVGSDGNFYGTTYGGGTSGFGTVFKMTPEGALTTLVSFVFPHGGNPDAGLVEGDGGAFYGTTRIGGTSGYGTTFKVTPEGVLTTLVSFDGPDGRNPQSALVRGSDGAFYGTTPVFGATGYGTAFKVTASGALTTLVSFSSPVGSNTYAGLVEGSDGNFYGTTSRGGASDSGMVFKVTPAGARTTLVNFSAANGSKPYAGLVEGSDGDFYGTTYEGGVSNAGTVFKMTPSGALTTLVNFDTTNGSNPYAGLVVGSDGNFYGTTHSGGASGYGTVFKMTPTGALTTLVSFNVSNGRSPYAKLVEGSDGNFYGTTYSGGASGYGTVFKVTPGGALTTLVSFNSANGRYPYAALAAGNDGKFYGTTSKGGEGDYGTVFQVTPGGALTTLVRFGPAIGSNPYAGLVQGSDGKFYGVTTVGGESNSGTVFKLTLFNIVTSGGNLGTGGALTELHSFDGSTSANPRGTPILGSDGKLYGTAADMVVWRIPLDTATLPPTLTTPAANTFINSTVNVAFTLPEAALPGSVTLTFAGASLTRVLTLAASQETAGAHSFSFDAGTPVGATEVASGLPLEVDGAYTVTLSYRDALGNPAATAVATNVTLDTQPPVVGGDFSPLLIAEGALPDYRSQATGGAVSYTQSPAPGAAMTGGTTTVIMSGTDAAGNVGQTYFYVRVVPANPVRSVLASKGAALPGAGVEGSGVAPGAVWSSFGVPSINDAGQVAVSATYKVGGKIMAGTFTGGPGTISLQRTLLKGDAAPGIANAVISVMREPLLGPDGSVAWVATLANAPGTTGAIGTSNNAAIFLDPDGAGPLAAFVVARKGAEAAGAAVWRSFGSVALGSNAVAFTGMLESKTAGVSPGPGGATTLSDSGLWIYDRTTSTTSPVLREGDALLGSTVKTINALVARPGSAGQGRGVESDGEAGYTAVRVTLADGRQALGSIGGDWMGDFEYVSGGTNSAGYGSGAEWQRFGLPAQNSVSAAKAFVGTVKAGTGAATALNNVAIFVEEDHGSEMFRLVAKGDSAPGVLGGLFASFKDPVNAGNRSVAFAATLKNVSGAVTLANNDGIWAFRSPTLSLVAREGAQPPEAPLGAQWKAFTSLALPEGRGPIFVASMHSKIGTASPGPGGVTTANDVGLWATDSFGALRLLMREGDAIGASTVKTFTVLSSVPGSPAQTRSFNNDAVVIVRVTDMTGAQHLVQIAVP